MTVFTKTAKTASGIYSGTPIKAGQIIVSTPSPYDAPERVARACVDIAPETVGTAVAGAKDLQDQIDAFLGREACMDWLDVLRAWSLVEVLEGVHAFHNQYNSVQDEIEGDLIAEEDDPALLEAIRHVLPTP